MPPDLMRLPGFRLTNRTKNRPAILSGTLVIAHTGPEVTGLAKLDFSAPHDGQDLISRDPNC
jgi:hypothetical protein